MATHQMISAVTLIAAADLSNAHFRFLSIVEDGEVALVSDSADAPDGVCYNTPTAQGQATEVVFLGIAKVVAGAAVAAGDAVMSDDQGRAITHTGTNPIAGVATSSAGNVGEVISVLLK